MFLPTSILLLAYLCQQVAQQHEYSAKELQTIIEAVPEVAHVRQRIPKQCFHIELITDRPEVACFGIQQYCTKPIPNAQLGPVRPIIYCVDRSSLDVSRDYDFTEPLTAPSIEKAKQALRRKHGKTAR